MGVAPSVWRGPFLVQFLDLLLHLAAKFQRMRDFLKWLGSSACPDHYNGAVTKHPAKGRFLHFNALDFGQEHFDGLAAGQSGLDHHAAIRHRHFGGVTAHHAHENHHDAANEQRRAADFHEMRVCALNSALCERVKEQNDAGQSEEQASHDNVPKHHDPVKASLVNYRFTGD